VRATHTSLSPVFALHDDPSAEVAALLTPVYASAPFAVAVDDEGTEHRLWRTGDGVLVAALQAALAERELVIADGHHRYEAARLYARERTGDEGAQRTLMLLVAAEDPGLVVQPTHRLVRGLAGDPERRSALATALHDHFQLTSVGRADLRPPAGSGPMELGWLDGATGQAHRGVMRTQAIADAAMPGLPDAYRVLDTAILQALVLTGAIGLTQDQIDRLDGLGYARSDEEAVALVDDGTYDAAFFLRPSPVSQVQAVARAGVNMPAKSTSFAPKVPTGLLLSPLG
jgi:uncharacterized protein (DUF1015 family)